MAIPGNANLLLLTEAAGAAPTGYTIDRSVRFNSADTAYLSRTPGSAGNRKTWTWAGWVKRSASGANMLFRGGTTANDSQYFAIQFNANDKLAVGAETLDYLITTQVFRDFSAWYHIVVALDVSQGTDADKLKLYINGVEVTAYDTDSRSSLSTTDKGVNQTQAHVIGGEPTTSNRYLNGYLADIHFIDGQQLDPTSFGEYDDNGVWQPIDASGLTYGTNGFHLDFADNSSAAALGYDAAGSNDWTVNNISVASGAGNDSLRDSPTNGNTASDTGAGGQVPGNYATLNPLANGSAVLTYSNGNLDIASNSSGSYPSAIGSIGVSSGKWYWEFATTSASSDYISVGIAKEGTSLSAAAYSVATAYVYLNDGRKGNSNSTPSYGASYTQNDVVGIALDLDAGTLVFYKNGVSQGTAYSSLSGLYFPLFGTYNDASPTGTFNFGQRVFAFSAPSGYKALCTANLDDPTIADGSTAMDVALWTGNGSSQSITGLSMSPDLVWVKQRNTDRDHCLCDIVRGTSKRLRSNTTDAETTESVVTAFNSDGFNIGSDNGVNQSGGTFVAWTWDAGSSTVSNTDGDITTSLRANATAGFSVATYSGSGTNGDRIGHGLGVQPDMVIIKARNKADDWRVYHSALGTGKILALNSTGAALSASNWQSISSSTLGLQNDSAINGSSYTYVAYFFAAVEGYSAFGSYVGNGSFDGPFLYLGFRPRYILFKRTNTSDDWKVFDAARLSYNTSGINSPVLYPHLSNAEDLNYASDFLSNGYKIRDTNSAVNAAGSTYIYAAFAESPQKYARAR